MDNTVYMVHLIHWKDDYENNTIDKVLGIFSSEMKAQAAINKFIREDTYNFWDWAIEPVTIDKEYR